MYTSEKLYGLLVLAGMLCINISMAQSNVKIDSSRVRKSFVLQVGGGIGSYTEVVNIKPPSLAGSVKRYSAVGTIRLMWYPSYRLRMGLETGYTNFYSYKVKDGNSTGSLELTAVPVLFVFSMQVVNRVNVYAGIGAIMETTHLQYNGSVKSKAIVLGSNIAVSYTYPVNNTFSIIGEAEWLNAYVTKDAAINIQLKLGWRFLRWR